MEKQLQIENTRLRMQVIQLQSRLMEIEYNDLQKQLEILVKENEPEISDSN